MSDQFIDHNYQEHKDNGQLNSVLNAKIEAVKDTMHLREEEMPGPSI